MELDENNFVRQIKKKNKKALDFAVDRYGNLVFKVVRSVLNTNYFSQYVEECVNDVFWAVWNNIQSFDEAKGSFKHWISAIAKYKAIDYKRRLYKHSTTECIDENLLGLEVSTENAIVSQENREELLRAIHELKEEDREIFIRRYFLDEEIESIAKTFSVDRNLVDQRLSRGRRFLREKLTLLKGEVR